MDSMGAKENDSERLLIKISRTMKMSNIRTKITQSLKPDLHFHQIMSLKSVCNCVVGDIHSLKS